MGGGRGGGANFPTSKDLQIVCGAYYYEKVHKSPELQGSADFWSIGSLLTVKRGSGVSGAGERT